MLIIHTVGVMVILLSPPLGALISLVSDALMIRGCGCFCDSGIPVIAILNFTNEGLGLDLSGIQNQGLVAMTLCSNF